MPLSLGGSLVPGGKSGKNFQKYTNKSPFQVGGKGVRQVKKTKIR